MSNRVSLEEWYILLLDAIAQRSTCIRRKAAAVAFDKYGRIAGIGYNGVPRHFPHCIDTPCEGANDPPGDTSRCMAIHAEVNCVMNSKSPEDITTMACSALPCFNCALVLANLPNLGKVYYKDDYADKRGARILNQAGIRLIPLTATTGFRVGDIVRIKLDVASPAGYPQPGAIGEVVDMSNGIVVDFREPFHHSHSCGGLCRHGRRFWEYGCVNLIENISQLEKVPFAG